MSLPITPLLAARLTASVIVAPLLYRQLAEEGQGWGGGAGAIARRLFFAALGAVVFFSLSARWIPEEQGPSAGKGFQSYVSGMLHHRLSHTDLDTGTVGNEGEATLDTAVRELQKGVDALPESASFRRYEGVVLADRGDYPAALKTLESAMDILERRAPERAREERGAWRRLFGPRVPSEAEIRAARAQLEGFHLGWTARVAALAAYRRLGPEAAPGELDREVAAEAAEYFQRYTVGSVLSIVTIPQIGLIVLVVGGILIGTRVLRPVPGSQQPVSAILWEGFILMMAVQSMPVLWLFGGKRPAPETQPGLFAALFLVGDALQFIAIGYLWWRLRGRGLTLAEIGLTTRNLGANVGVGVLAAFVIVPSAILVGLITSFVSDRFFPNIPPPYHPLQGLTATSTSPEIRGALFLAAVVGAPFMEEIFFRGALFGALRRRYGFWVGMALSSAFFAILHPQLPLGFLPIAALAAAFSGLYEWRRSLVPNMVVHALNNGLVFLMLTLMFPRAG
jgi:membrane protease YdiL (CAAX protease family)